MLTDRRHHTFVKQHDAVSQGNGAWSVGNHDGGAARHHGAHRITNLVLFARVDRARRIVEHQHPRVGNDRPRDRHALTLAAAQ